jgi:hypothetical protein
MIYTRIHAVSAKGLNARQPSAPGVTRKPNRLYDAAVRQALKVLIPMLVDAMERHGHLDLDPVIKAKLVQVSAASIDRMLANARSHIDGQRKRRKGAGLGIRRSIPVLTFAD